MSKETDYRLANPFLFQPTETELIEAGERLDRLKERQEQVERIVAHGSMFGKVLENADLLQLQLDNFPETLPEITLAKEDE